MLLKAINYWSFPGGLEGSLSPFEAIHLAKEHGFEAIELCIGDSGTAFGTDATEDTCTALVAEASKVGVKIASVASGLYWDRNLADSQPEKRAQAVADLEKMIPITAWLGAKTLLTIPGAVEVFFLPERPVLSYDFVHQHATEGLKKVLPTAETHQVRLGIENVWNKFLLSPIEMRDFIDQFKSPWIGAYVDVANVVPFGFAEQWIRILGPRVAGVHFKDYRKAVGTIEGFVDLLEGDVNYGEVVKALHEIGYNGPVPAEMIPGYKTNPMVRIANTSRAMDAILGR
jgi:hexulose-6-phosphate isomerase